LGTEEKIIYVVVAETVQHPTTTTIVGQRLVRLSGVPCGSKTRDIVQIPGRLAAQACHAVRRMGHHMVIDAVKELLLFNGIVKSFKKFKQVISALGSLVVYEPITTIILSCRDSFELEHTYNILRDHAGVLAFKFNDTNAAVYCVGCTQPCKGEVTTAFATVPVDKLQVQGYLDYLPLWTPK
jgi:hypothetical protein